MVMSPQNFALKYQELFLFMSKYLGNYKMNSVFFGLIALNLWLNITKLNGIMEALCCFLYSFPVAFP